MKTHEETWTEDPDDSTMIKTGDGAGSADFDEPARDNADVEPSIERRQARAKLAAQAPAMARLLLEMHERGSFDGCHDESAVDAVLRAAGVLP